mmetsp:Transcript_14036/g.46089  ORF Transcript_14036/g.46089 Transcript_14036/m.46089 type:complete len:423 (-) Transcript_14036:1810-3078(-)
MSSVRARSRVTAKRASLRPSTRGRAAARVAPAPAVAPARGTPFRRPPPTLLFCTRGAAPERAVRARAASGDGGDSGGGGGGDNRGGNGGGGGDGGHDPSPDEEPEDFSDEDLLLPGMEPMASASEVTAEAAKAGVKMPAELMEIAQAEGMRRSILARYFQIAKTTPGFLLAVPWIRDRILADPYFLFKVGLEYALDAGFATAAELNRGAKEFLAEWEFFAADLVTSFALDVTIVSLLAPAASIGATPQAVRRVAKMKLPEWLGKKLSVGALLPPAAFARAQSGQVFTLWGRTASVLSNVGVFFLVGTAAGFAGQTMANLGLRARSAMTPGGKEALEEQEASEAILMPPIMRTAFTWGLYSGISTNLRYQCIIGAERFSEYAQRKIVGLPVIFIPISSLLLRTANSWYAGEQYLEFAWWAGSI